MLRSLKYESSIPIADFADFLSRPNITPIDIGYVKDPQGSNIETLILLGPEPGQLDAHPFPDG